MRKNNLIIAAHPDDEILGCGGIIKKYSNEEDFFVVIMTGGADGRYGGDMEAQLRQNAKQANGMIGTKGLFLRIFQTNSLRRYRSAVSFNPLRHISQI